MSGGKFNYNQFRLRDMSWQLERLLTNDMANSVFSLDIMRDIAILSARLKEDFIRLERLDLLLSGDDEEDSYRKRLKEDLEEL